MNSTANWISVFRMIIAPVLLWVNPLGFGFITIYLVCGVSDIADGYIARRTNTISTLGAKIDTIADLIVVVVLVYVLYPVVNMTRLLIGWLIIIAIIRVVSMLVVVVKYHTFAVLHTYGNKLTGLILFFFPLSLAVGQYDALNYGICLIASMSAMEELVIHLTSKQLKLNRKSLFINDK